MSFLCVNVFSGDSCPKLFHVPSFFCGDVLNHFLIYLQLLFLSNHFNNICSIPASVPMYSVYYVYVGVA